MRVLCAVEGECVFGCSRRRAGVVAATPNARVLDARSALETAARYEDLGADARALREAVARRKHEMIVSFGAILGPASALARGGVGNARRCTLELRKAQTENKRLESELDVAIKMIAARPHEPRVVHAGSERSASASSKASVSTSKTSMSGASASASSASSMSASSGAGAISASSTSASASAISTSGARENAGGSSAIMSTSGAASEVSSGIITAMSGAAAAGSADTSQLEKQRLAAELTHTKEEAVRLRGEVSTLKAQLNAKSGGGVSKSSAEAAAEQQTDTKTSTAATTKTPAISKSELRERIKALVHYYDRAVPPIHPFKQIYRTALLHNASRFLMSIRLLKSRSAYTSWSVTWQNFAVVLNVQVGGRRPGNATNASIQTASIPTVAVSDVDTKHENVGACRLCRLYRYIALTLFQAGSLPFYRLRVAGFKVSGPDGVDFTTEIDKSTMSAVNTMMLNFLENKSVLQCAEDIRPTKADDNPKLSLPSIAQFEYEAFTASPETVSSEFMPFLALAMFRTPNYDEHDDSHKSFLTAHLLMAGCAPRALTPTTVTLKAFTAAEDTAKTDIQIRIATTESAFWLASLAWKRDKNALRLFRGRIIYLQQDLRDESEKVNQKGGSYAVICEKLLNDEHECKIIQQALLAVCSEDAIITHALTILHSIETDPSVLDVVREYWEYSEDDTALACFLSDIHAATKYDTKMTTNHALIATNVVFDDRDLMCYVPVICATVRLMRKITGDITKELRAKLLIKRTDVAKLVIERTIHKWKRTLACNQPAFGAPSTQQDNRLCGIFDITVMRQLLEADVTTTIDVKGDLKPLDIQSRKSAATLLKQTMRTPEWCDIPLWLLTMRESEKAISTIATALYVDVDICSPHFRKHVCSSYSCCISSACSSYASLSTETSCTMIDDVITVLHCTQCVQCLNAMHDITADRREWLKTATCNELRSALSHLPLQRALADKCDAERAFCTVSHRLSSLATLLRKIINERATKDESCFSIACKVALCAINTAFSQRDKPLASRSYSAVLRDYGQTPPAPAPSGAGFGMQTTALPPPMRFGVPPPPPPKDMPPLPNKKKNVDGLGLFADAFLQTPSTQDSTLLKSYLTLIGSENTKKLFAATASPAVEGSAGMMQYAVPILLHLAATDTYFDRKSEEFDAMGILQKFRETDRNGNISLVRAAWLFGCEQRTYQIKTDGKAEIKTKGPELRLPDLQNHAQFAFNAAELFLHLTQSAQKDLEDMCVLHATVSDGKIDELLEIDSYKALATLYDLTRFLSQLKSGAYNENTKGKLDALLQNVTQNTARWERYIDALQIDKENSSSVFRAYLTDRPNPAASVDEVPNPAASVDEEVPNPAASVDEVRRIFRCNDPDNKSKVCSNLIELVEEIERTCAHYGCAQEDDDLTTMLSKLRALTADATPHAFGRSRLRLLSFV